MIFAAAGVMGTWDLISPRVAGKGRELAVAAALALVVAVVANIPLGQAWNDDVLTFYNAANEFRDLGRMDEASALWNEAIESDPQFHPAYNNLGRAALADGKLDEATAYFERGLAVHSQGAQLLLGLAAVRAQRGDEAGAIGLVEQAMRAQSEIVDELPARAREERLAGRGLSAVAVLRAATRAHADNAAMHAELGETLLALGQTREALDELRRAIALDDGLSATANNLAWTLATSPDDGVRNGPEAVAMAEKACLRDRLSVGRYARHAGRRVCRVRRVRQGQGDVRSGVGPHERSAAARGVSRAQATLRQRSAATRYHSGKRRAAAAMITGPGCRPSATLVVCVPCGRLPAVDAPRRGPSGPLFATPRAATLRGQAVS